MKKKTFTVTSLILLIVAVRLFARSTDLVENYYANIIFKTIAPPLSRLTGILPFSAAEILVVLLVLWLSIDLLTSLVRRHRRQPDEKISTLYTFITMAGLVYLVFMGLWGLNYYRMEFAQIAGLDTGNISIQELYALGDSLVEEANQLRAGLKEDDDGVMSLPNRQEVFKQAVAGYDVLALKYPQLEGEYGRPKGLLLSRIVSYTGMYGFYLPFTGEANINTAIPESMLPFSTCHEMAHQRGIAREGEANFVAYLSCVMNPRDEFQYSGTLMALTYVLNAINGRDQQQSQELIKKLSPGVVRDLQDIRLYSEKHRGPISRISNRINDIYLRSNSQTSGVRGYSEIVELLAAYRRSMSAQQAE